MSIQFSKNSECTRTSLVPNFSPFSLSSFSFLLLGSPLTDRQMGNLSKKSRFGFNLDSGLCVPPFESIFQRQYLKKLVDVGISFIFGSFFSYFGAIPQQKWINTSQETIFLNIF